LTRRSRDEGVRRAEILDAAVDRFGRNGYENTKWADIADDVGIGPTALYHYFDSKQHCLYVILDEALGQLHERFDSIIAEHPDPRDALRALCTDCFALSEREVLRNRVLVAEQALLSGASTSQREEQARVAGRQKTRALELAWARFLADAMRQGAIPERNPRMLARAILGLYNSIWHWYRPDQTLLLPTLAEFFGARMMAVAGVPPGGVPPDRAQAP
jgi:AcrR family transcriptional regulator